MKKIVFLLFLFIFVFNLTGCFEDVEYIEHKVTFESEGEVVEELNIESGLTISPIDDPVKKGYTFLGWYLGEEKWSFDQNKVLNDIKLTAKWSINSYTLTVDTGSGNKKEYDVQYGEDITKYTPTTTQDYCYYEANRQIPNNMPASDMYVKFNLINLLDTFEIEGNKIVSYLGDDLVINIPETYNLNNEKVTITTIGEEAFKWCKISEITIPNTITVIEKRAFTFVSQLSEITLPESITTIEEEAFYYCESIKSINIPKNVTNIGKNAFQLCDQLREINVDEENQNYKSINGNLYSKDGTTLIKYSEGKYDRTFEIPSSVTRVEDFAFYYSDDLTKVIIPSNVEYIGEDAFGCCLKLESVEFSGGVKYIGDSAFSLCEALVSIELPEGLTTIGKGVFGYCYALETVSIPSTVTSIGTRSFSSCKNLVSINVHEDNQHYKSIDGNLYSKDETEFIKYCIGKKDETFEIPNSVTKIAEYALDGAVNLVNIVIPEGVEYIGQYALYNCENVISINIPSTVATIGKLAFYNSGLLESINVDQDNQHFKSENGVLYSKDGTVLICFPPKNSIESLTISETVTTIKEYAFSLCEFLKTVIVPESVVTIEKYGFYRCENLTVYCKTASLPETWASPWYYSVNVEWGYIE